MRWPLVPRSLYEDVVTDLRAQLKDERARSQYLTTMLADMKVSGATLVRSISADGAVLLHAQPRSAVQQAIDENARASANPRLRAHLAKWAEKELDAGAKEQLILDRLRTWSVVSADDDDDDEDDDTAVIGVG